MFWGNFEDVTQIDLALEDASHTITSEKKDGERVYSYNDAEIDLTDFAAALEALIANRFEDGETARQEEISLPLHLDNENFPTVSSRITRYAGELCLVEVDGESVSPVSRSEAMDLVEAVQTIVLGQNS